MPLLGFDSVEWNSVLRTEPGELLHEVLGPSAMKCRQALRFPGLSLESQGPVNYRDHGLVTPVWIVMRPNS